MNNKHQTIEQASQPASPPPPPSPLAAPTQRPDQGDRLLMIAALTAVLLVVSGSLIMFLMTRTASSNVEAVFVPLTATPLTQPDHVVIYAPYFSTTPAPGAERFKQVVAAYHAPQRIHVDWQNRDPDDISGYVLANIYAGEKIDLAAIDSSYVADLADSGLLRPIDPNELSGISSCLVDGVSYCYLDSDGFAWILPRSGEHPAHAYEILGRLAGRR